MTSRYPAASGQGRAPLFRSSPGGDQGAAPEASGPPLTGDVLIVGGGLVGMTLGIALADAGLSVLLVDREDPQTARSAPYDGRASAIARASQRALQRIGLWQGMAPGAAPIWDIRVTDGRTGAGDRDSRTAWAASFFVHYKHDQVDNGDRSDAVDGLAPPLGYIVENRVIRQACQEAASRLPNLTLLAPCDLTEVKRGGQTVTARLADGRRLRAAVLLAADGRGSAQRRAAGIQTLQWRYGQTAIVATLLHEQPHNGVAHEHFLPAGPFAVLPMTDLEKPVDGLCHRSSLVWAERSELVPTMLALDDSAFDAQMQRRFGDSLGNLHIYGKRWSYPLSVTLARRYLDRRLALVGDAAHAIHPIAGQGLNMGLRDVAALAEVLVEAHRLGLDLGSASVLERYERWRRFDNGLMVAVTDGLNRLFSNDLPPVRLARDVGLAAVNRLPPVKRFFMRHAMGLVGDLPRLLRGEAL